MTNTIYFTSNRNYLKKDSSSGVGSMAGPSTSAYGGYIFINNFVVKHNLGFVPMFKVYYEPYGDGVIYPYTVTRNEQEAFNPLNGAVTGPGIISWIDSTNLTIQLFYVDASLASKQFPIYYTIYKDFQL